MCFLWINCMFIYGFWWESKLLIALICIFIWFFARKIESSCLCESEIYYKCPNSWLGGVQWNTLSEKWIAPSNLFNLPGKKKNQNQHTHTHPPEKKPKMSWKAANQFDSNGTEENLNWQGKNPGWCYLWDLQPGKAEGDNLKGTSLI